jgi:hypothetical protein
VTLKKLGSSVVRITLQHDVAVFQHLDHFIALIGQFFDDDLVLLHLFVQAGDAIVLELAHVVRLSETRTFLAFLNFGKVFTECHLII